MEDFTDPCPCGTGKAYEHCCKMYHDGKQPENARLLMRSRYSAYALNIPEYIVRTTHPASSHYSDNRFAWKLAVSRFSSGSLFQKLEVLDFRENDAMAEVTFTAYISQGGHDSTFTEKSIFENFRGSWLYLSGHLASGYAPDLVTPGPFRLLPLAYYGDPVLRRVAAPVLEMTDEIRVFAEAMIETMDANDGVGLAAPQVHRSIRLFVARIPSESGQNKNETSPVKVFINPKLSAFSEETGKASEGCLSIPAIRSSVERPKEITLEYTTLDGLVVKERFSDLAARIIMHESDHLDGILFLDRAEPEEQLKCKPFLRRLENRIGVERIL